MISDHSTRFRVKGKMVKGKFQPYKNGGRTVSHLNECKKDEVYEPTDNELDYVNCRKCFKKSQLMDYRKAPGA